MAPWDDTILTQKMSGSQVRRSGWTSAALLAVSSLAVQGESSVSISLTFLLASQDFSLLHHNSCAGTPLEKKGFAWVAV